jgi:hypothetical protein
MIGEYVLTQHDLEKDTVKFDAIGMGSYNIDVRHVQRTFHIVSRFPVLRGETINEGYLSIPVAPYEIPYRSLVPKFTECTNLLVPVCISSTQLAYASIRMEPQYMIMGHAAGVAAAMAVKNQLPVQQVDIGALKKKLTGQEQVLTLQDNPNGVFGNAKEVVIDDDMARFVEKTGTWYDSEDPLASRHDITYMLSPKGVPSSVVYRPYLPSSGTYKVYGWWPGGESFAGNVPFVVKHARGEKTLAINQGEKGGQWVLLGEFPFEQGWKGSVTINNQSADGNVAADAFRFEKIQ